jgi:AcrR family transcriptional regulator
MTSFDQEQTLPRKERERERHRLEVLHAAESLLETRFYHEITVQEVAARAEFSVGYLYRLFPNKEEIYASLLRHRLDELEKIIGGCVNSDAPVEQRLHDLVRGVEDWFKRNTGFAANYLIALFTLARSTGTLGADLARHEAAVRAQLEALFRQGMEERVLTVRDPALVVSTLRALLWGFVGENLLSGFDPSNKEKWTDYGPTIVRIIMRAFGPESEQGR